MTSEQQPPPGGAALHYAHPWATPPAERDPVRRLRGHLVLPVTVWLAAGREGMPVGLTVSSLVLAQGEPPMLAGLVGPDTEIADLLSSQAQAPFVVHVLGAAHRRVAQHFSGELPAPEEMVAASPASHGFALRGVADRLSCRALSTRPFGWSVLVEAVVEAVEAGSAGKGLAWYHGAYHPLAG